MDLFLINLKLYSAEYVVFLFFLTICLLIKFQGQSEKIFGSLLVALYASGIVSTENIIDGFSNQGLITLILIIMCSLALEKTRFLRLVTTNIIGRNYKLTWLRLCCLTSLSSSVLNNTAVVSAMLAPIRNNPYHPMGKLLIPLSYSAILGGTLTLVGTSTNLIVNSLAVDLGYPPLGFFDFTPIGICLVLVCSCLLYNLMRFLPDTKKIAVEYSEYLIDAEVVSSSTLIGKSVEENGLRHLETLFLVEILRGNKLISPVSPSEIIYPGDRLFFSGDIKKVRLLNEFDGLAIFANDKVLPLDNLSEVVLRPESELVGKTLKSVGFRALFNAAVVALKRDGEKLSGKLGEIELKPGDYLILAIGEGFSTRDSLDSNFYFLSEIETEELLTGFKEKLSILGFFMAIGLAAFEFVTLFKSMFLLLFFLIMLECISPKELIQRFPRNIWIIIGSALLLSQALNNTGALSSASSWISTQGHIFNPITGLIFVYVLAWLLTELITNNAAAALSLPIAMEMAINLNVNPTSYMIAVAFGASASFVSPYGYQTNLMVFNAGQYRLQDFAKVGIPMCLLYGVTVLTTIPIFIGF